MVIGTKVSAENVKSLGVTPEDIEKLLATAPEYGLEIL
jgi:hypothetical protein